MTIVLTWVWVLLVVDTLKQLWVRTSIDLVLYVEKTLTNKQIIFYGVILHVCSIFVAVSKAWS